MLVPKRGNENKVVIIIVKNLKQLTLWKKELHHIGASINLIKQLFWKLQPNKLGKRSDKTELSFVLNRRILS